MIPSFVGPADQFGDDVARKDPTPSHDRCECHNACDEVTFPAMLEWTDHLGNRRSGAIPPNIRVFVDLIGFNTTVDLMLALGGTFVCFPRGRPKPDGLLANAIGIDAAIVLGREFFGAPQRIPISGRFLARCLRGRGCSVQDIARQLRRTDKTIRIYLKADES